MQPKEDDLFFIEEAEAAAEAAMEKIRRTIDKISQLERLRVEHNVAPNKITLSAPFLEALEEEIEASRQTLQGDICMALIRGVEAKELISYAYWAMDYSNPPLEEEEEEEEEEELEIRLDDEEEEPPVQNLSLKAGMALLLGKDINEVS